METLFGNTGREMTGAVAIAVPLYNEERRWDSSYWALATADPFIQWVFVDDGSTDATRDVARQLQASNVEVLSLPQNRGKAEAVRTGLLHCLKKHAGCGVVGFLDGDGAFDPAEVLTFARRGHARLGRGGLDAIWSSRVALLGRSISRRAARHYAGRIVGTLLFRGVGASPYDSQSGFKLFARSARLEQLLEEPFATRWFFEIEMVLNWNESLGDASSRMKVREEPLGYWRDVPGSKIRGCELIRIARELVLIRSRIVQSGY